MSDERPKLEGYPTFLESWNQQKLGNKYRYLITVVGYSTDPPKMFIKAIQETGVLERVLFIVSQESEEKLDEILRATGFPSSKTDKYKLKSKTDTETVFDGISKFVSECNTKEHILIDATAGSKPMTAGAYLAASSLDIDVMYADYNEYDAEKRKPIPEKGQFVATLKNPLNEKKAFESALHSMNHGRFRQAEEIFDNLAKKNTSSTHVYNLYKNIALAYALWDEFWLDDAVGKFDAIFENTESLKKNIVDAMQKNYLALKEKQLPLIFFANAQRNMELQKYDFAALLYYRAIESLCTVILCDNKVQCSEVEWDTIPAEVKEKYKNTRTEIFPEEANKEIELRPKIALLDQVMLAFSYNSNIFSSVGEIKRIKDVSQTRNESYLIHAEKPISQEKAEKIGVCAKKHIKRYYEQLESAIEALKYPKFE